eukprot:TRINITY_DN43852_c0_g1_i1.p1 TRINITY_DN43852_c0_g1~~TRINITY_DN43852_c0_g1_i1.p1  ORF type:complete len:171 (-),score=19.62 TRINITY_DN43852_c0_g1_i1:76-588(-)
MPDCPYSLTPHAFDGCWRTQIMKERWTGVPEKERQVLSRNFDFSTLHTPMAGTTRGLRVRLANQPDVEGQIASSLTDSNGFLTLRTAQGFVKARPSSLQQIDSDAHSPVASLSNSASAPSFASEVSPFASAARRHLAPLSPAVRQEPEVVRNGFSRTSGGKFTRSFLTHD